MDEMTGRQHRRARSEASAASEARISRPAVKLVDAWGKEIVFADRTSRLLLPAGRRAIEVEEGAAGLGRHVLGQDAARVVGTQDITGGLPRVTEIFEARKPKDPAVIAEIDGTVELRRERRGKRTIIVRSEDGHRARAPRAPRQAPARHAGDLVRAATSWSTARCVPHDILRIPGEEALQQYLVREIQNVYRSQRVEINDKHIEIIVGQMLRKVKISDPGDTDLLRGDQIDRASFERVNAEIVANGGKPARRRAGPARHHQGLAGNRLVHLRRIVPGHHPGPHRGRPTPGKVDYLAGFKENVIMGHLIPAGTGLPPTSTSGEPPLDESTPAVVDSAMGCPAGEDPDRR